MKAVFLLLPLVALVSSQVAQAVDSSTEKPNDVAEVAVSPEPSAAFCGGIALLALLRRRSH